MIKVIFNEESFEIENGTTLQQLVIDQGEVGECYTVNGRAVPQDTILTPYNVVEYNDDGEGTEVTSFGDDVESSRMVDINLADFTGRFGVTTIENTLDTIRARYNVPVNIQIIRGGQIIQTEILENGDRAMVVIASGHKGARV